MIYEPVPDCLLGRVIDNVLADCDLTRDEVLGYVRRIEWRKTKDAMIKQALDSRFA